MTVEARFKWLLRALLHCFCCRWAANAALQALTTQLGPRRTAAAGSGAALTKAYVGIGEALLCKPERALAALEQVRGHCVSVKPNLAQVPSACAHHLIASCLVLQLHVCTFAWHGLKQSACMHSSLLGRAGARTHARAHACVSPPTGGAAGWKGITVGTHGGSPGYSTARQGCQERGRRWQQPHSRQHCHLGRACCAPQSSCALRLGIADCGRCTSCCCCHCMSVFILAKAAQKLTCFVTSRSQLVICMHGNRGVTGYGCIARTLHVSTTLHAGAL
jgi:hypothetical protein